MRLSRLGLPLFVIATLSLQCRKGHAEQPAPPPPGSLSTPQKTVLPIWAGGLQSGWDDYGWAPHDEKAKGRETQFYSMLSTRAIYHQGWKAALVTPATPDGWGE